MTVLSHPEFDGHELVEFVTDRRSGLVAIIAIHSTVLGPAGGGIRFFPYASEMDAVTDVLRLSKAMTNKMAMGEVPLGGGKSVILGDPRTDKTEALLEAYGDAVEALGGRYICGEDMGMTPDDMEVVARRTDHARGTASGSGDTSPLTAHTVFLSIRAAVRHRLGTGLDGIRVAVQGVGHVGEPLVRRLVDAGARVIIADVDAERVAALESELGVVAEDPAKIHMVAADIFSPCAMGASVNDDTIDQLGARIVCGSANNQLADERHGEILHERHIVYVPDYVANAGGAISALRERVHYEPHEFEDRIESIGRRVHDILERSARTGEAPSDAADSIAAEIVEAARTQR